MFKRLICVCVFATGAAQAATFEFGATLSGAQEVPPVVTSSSGTAQVFVDNGDETIDFSLSVQGISVDDLEDGLVAAPVGPIHLHLAPAGSNGPVVIPFAFDPATYIDTDDGFALNVSDFAFADAIALSGAGGTFDQFLAGMIDEQYYVNVHTDEFASGELRGQVSPVPLPAGLALSLGAIGLLGGMRLRRRS